MEATADNILNQVTRAIIDKIGKQDLDPTLLSNFAKTFLSKIKNSNIIKQVSISEDQNNSNKANNKNTLVDQLKQAYKELLRDQSYINEYKKFQEKIHSKKTKNTNPFLEVLKKIVASKKESENKKTETKEGRTKLIEDKPKIQEVTLAGFTEKASRTLKDKFANIFSGFFDRLKGFFDKLQGPKGGFGVIGGALALLLGGLAALVAGLMTDGPFKGLLKILSKVGIQGALTTLKIAAKFFMSGLKSAIMAPIDLLRGAAKAIGKIFGKNAFKAIIAPIRGFSNIFTKILGSFGKFFTKGILTKIPVIGSLISFGFAFSRFKSGDVIGGLIDIVSGLVPLLYLTGVGAPFVIPIQLGLDVLNAMLDFKAGGANKEASEKKGGILLGWLKGIGSLIYKGVKSLPIIGPAIKAVEEFNAGNFGKGLKQLAYIVTPLEFIGALLGDEEASGLTKTVAGAFKGIGSMLLSLGKWIAKTMYKILTNIPIIGPAIKAIENFSAGNFGKGLKQLAYILPPFEMLGALLGDEEVGGVASGIVSAGKSIGSMLLSLGKWIRETLPKVLRNTFIIGPLIKAIENFNNGNYLKGLKQLAYIFPPFEIIGALLGDTDVTGMASFSGSVLKTTGQIITDLWTWMKDTLWEKISGFVNNLINGFKDWWKNLSWDPRSWFGELPAQPSVPAQEQTNIAAQPPVPLADGGVVTKPTNAIVGEAGPEAVLPLDKFFSNINTNVNNAALDQIASNTEDTNMSIKSLSNVLLKLITVLDKKISTQGGTTIVNAGGQQSQITSASVIANSNMDPIRRVRSQFAY